MSNVLVFGRGPMPWQQVEPGPASGRRTWQVAQALRRAGHRVLVIAVQPPESAAHDVEREQRDGVTQWSISEHQCHEQPELVARQLEAHAPDAIIGVGGAAAAIVVNHVGDLPFWTDLEGEPLAEAQAQAAGGQGNWLINEAYRRLVPVLMRSDRLSCRTETQRGSLIGQLGMVGRLLAENDGYEFVSVLPDVLDEDELDRLRGIDRRLRAPTDSFYLLWSGPFRAWADVDTLFEAVETLMAENERVEFCAVGGHDPGAARSVARLSHRAAQSPFRKRIDLPGWVSREDLMERYARADAAVFTERPCYQSIFGGRGRVLDWLGAGLPVVCTDRSETAMELAHVGAAQVVPAGGVIALIDATRALVEDPEEALTMGLRGRRFVRETRRASIGLSPLLDWARAPSRAPAKEGHVALERQPGALRLHAATMRGHLANHGAAGTALMAGRFAVRRLRSRALKTIDQLAEPPEATS